MGRVKDIVIARMNEIDEGRSNPYPEGQQTGTTPRSEGIVTPTDTEHQSGQAPPDDSEQ